MAPSFTEVDLSGYPDPDSDEFFLLPEDERYCFEDYHLFTAETTAEPAGTIMISRAYCLEQNEEGDLCEGDIELVRLDLPKEIRWKCLQCGHRGMITGFENTRSDLSSHSKDETQRYLDKKYKTPFGEFDFQDDFMDTGNDENSAPDNDFITWMEGLNEQERDAFFGEMEDNLYELDRQFTDEMGGLNPEELAHLLTCDWEDPQSIVYLRDDLKPADVENSLLFRNARSFLLKVQREGSFGQTEKGFLKRKHISELIDELTWPEGYFERLTTYNKALNERDAWLLHVIRLLLEYGGLIRKHKKAFRPVLKRAALSEETRSGELYRQLFSTYFNKLNISYLNRAYGEFPIVQSQISFILYRLKQVADGWVSSEELVDHTLLYSGIVELLGAVRFGFQTPASFFYTLLLQPLEMFGMIESRYSSPPIHSYDDPDQFRKTPLFDKFVQSGPYNNS